LKIENAKMQHAHTCCGGEKGGCPHPPKKRGLPETSRTYRTYREAEAEAEAEATWKLGQLSTPLEQASVRPRATTMTPVTPRRN